jgi:hypothetical protein
LEDLSYSKVVLAVGTGDVGGLHLLHHLFYLVIFRLVITENLLGFVGLMAVLAFKTSCFAGSSIKMLLAIDLMDKFVDLSHLVFYMVEV